MLSNVGCVRWREGPAGLTVFGCIARSGGSQTFSAPPWESNWWTTARPMHPRKVDRALHWLHRAPVEKPRTARSREQYGSLQSPLLSRAAPPARDQKGSTSQERQIHGVHSSGARGPLCAREERFVRLRSICSTTWLGDGRNDTPLLCCVRLLSWPSGITIASPDCKSFLIW